MPRGGPRPNSGGPRPNSGGPRPNSGGARPNSGGARANSGGARQKSGGARANSGGARVNSGGARPKSGGARTNSGGARVNSGVIRKGAGRPRKRRVDPPYVDPDAPCTREADDNITSGPAVDPNHLLQVTPSVSGRTQGSGEEPPAQRRRLNVEQDEITPAPAPTPSSAPVPPRAPRRRVGRPRRVPVLAPVLAPAPASTLAHTAAPLGRPRRTPTEAEPPAPRRKRVRRPRRVPLPLSPPLPPSPVEEDEITPAPVPAQPPSAASDEVDEITPAVPRQSESAMVDPVVMTDAVTAESGLFPVYYAFNTEAEQRKQMGGDAQSDIPPELTFARTAGERMQQSCSICGENTHRRTQCPQPFWTCRISNCQYCGAVLLGNERDGTCCGKKNAASWGVMFRRRHANEHLKRVYSLRAFRNNTLAMNAVFATALTFMDMSYTQGGGPSLLRLQGTASVAMRHPDSRYSFLWSNDPPSTDPSAYGRDFVPRAVANPDVKAVLRVLYEHLQPRPSVVRERYRAFFRGPGNRGNRGNRGNQGNQEQGDEDDQGDDLQAESEVTPHAGARIRQVVRGHGVGPLPEHAPGMPSGLEAFIVDAAGLFRQPAPMYEVQQQEPQAANNNGSQRRQLKYKRLKAGSERAERGAFPLLYPYGERDKPFDMAKYLTARNSNESDITDEDLNEHRFRKLTWAAHTKRRLYTDNLLLDSGPILQQWSLRIQTNIEDMRPQFLEDDQRKRMATETEIQDATREDGTVDPGVGRLFLPDTVVNSPAYWKQKRLDVQAIVARKGPPTLFITVTMNPWRDELGKLGMDIVNKGAFTPVTGVPRVFDRPDLMARVYNQFSHAISNQITKRAEEYFGFNCIAYSAKLEFQERNTPHHHGLFWLECGVLDDVDAIDAIISAELPRIGEDDELRALVKRYNMHRHSPYCKRDGRECRFGYDANTVTPYTTIDPTSNRVVYRRRELEDLKVVPYNPRLTREFKAHIIVERTQAGGAVAYLMKYTFKPPKNTTVQVRTSPEEEQGQKNHQDDQQQQEQEQDNAPSLRNDIRLFKRARRIGALEACWRLFEFRNVAIFPPVEACTIYLPGERAKLIRNPGTTAPAYLSSDLERYFARSPEFAQHDFHTYFEKYKLYKKLPRSMQAASSNLPRDQGTPQLWVTERSEQRPVVARIRYVPPSNVELFALRLLLLNVPFTTYEDARTVDGIQYHTFRAAAVAAGLYIDGNEYYTAFDQAVEIYRTPSELRYMIVTSYQQGADPQRLIEAHTDTLCADIVGDQYVTPEDKLNELKCRLIQISNRHGGRLIREHTYFADIDLGSDAPTTEVERMEHHVLRSMHPVNRDQVAQRYASLHTQQKAVVDEIFECVMSRNEQDRHRTDGKAFFLQGHAGAGKTYLLSVLRDKVEAERLFVEICATTGIAASLYRGGRTLHSLLGIGVEDKDASDQHSKLSKYTPDSQRGQLIKSLALLIVNEASMMQRVLFEHVDTILKDLRCPPQDTRARELPYFGGLVVVFSGDYLQLLPVVPSRRTVVSPDGNIQVIPVSLLDKLPWFSTLWEKVKVLRITQQIHQSADTEFANLLMYTAKGLLPEHIPLPLKSTANVYEAYKFLWRWVTTGNKLDVDLDRILVCPTNSLVNQHNEQVLEMFPGRLLKFRSSTTIEPFRPNTAQA